MEEVEIKIKIRELIKKLTEKFDKCNWYQNSNGIYVLPFDGIGQIHIDRQLLIVVNKDNVPIIENIPTAEEGDAYNHMALYSKIYKKDRIQKDKHLDIIINELDRIK